MSSCDVHHRHIGFSPHARERMAEMGVTKREVRDVVKHPDVTYGPNAAKYGDEARRVYIRGQLAVVIAADVDTVVTVLWHLDGGAAWTRG